MPGMPEARKLAIEAVLTMWPPCPRSFIRGTKVWTPLITPWRLTPSTQSQSSYEEFVDRPEQVHAGIVEQKGDRPHPRLGLVGRRGEAVARGDVEPDPGHLAIVENGKRLLDRILPNVGDHHLAALVEQHPGEAEADAVGAAGDEGRAAREVLHFCFFRF